MTKADLVKVIAKDTGLIRKDIAIVVDQFLSAVKDSMKNGSRIEIRGFGTFNLKQRKERIGRNPKTGKKVPVPERVVPTFKFSRAFKDEIAGANK
ncbi:MAG: integration host factor subunit beta [Candidatus Cloacimonetes bacterium]|nr:integration host factor subunit beta [Candidatus Cloacimonadota bacterium]